jgi:hypothetical protein
VSVVPSTARVILLITGNGIFEKSASTGAVSA